MKEFQTAVKAVTEPVEDTAMQFSIDGRELVCYPPEPAQLAVLMAAVGRHASLQTKVAGVIDFFVEVMDEESHAYIRERLLDRTDPFGLEEVEEIMSWMIEEWSGRPTESPSVSTRSQRSGGRKSTRPTTKSTSSPSVQTAS